MTFMPFTQVARIICLAFALTLALAALNVQGASAEVSGPTSPVTQAATAFRGTPINVMCEQTWDEWGNLMGIFGIAYMAFVPYSDLSTIYLGPTTCNEMLAATADTAHTVTVARATALQTFLHEMQHTAGIRDEHQAEQMSMYLYRWYLVKFWGYSLDQSAQMYQDAWARHLERGVGYTIPARYTPKLWLARYQGPEFS